MSNPKVQYVNANGSSFIDFENGKVCIVTLNGNSTFSFNASNPDIYVIQLRQDATGSRTVTWPSNVVWPSNISPTLTTTPNYSDIITFIWNGSRFIGISTNNFNA